MILLKIVEYFYLWKFVPTAIVLTLCSISFAQDSTSVQNQLQQLKVRVDSLEALLSRTEIDSITLHQPEKSELQNLPDTLQSADILSDLTSFFSFNEQDQSSRRKRIDDLLNALRSQPGTITFKGDATSILHWKTGNNHLANGSGSFDLFAFVNFGNNTNLFINLEAIGGNGMDERLETFSSLNGDAGSLQDNSGRDLIHVLEAWSEFRFFGEWLKVTLGKIDLTNYFDINDAANDETLQFITGPFINSSAFPVPSNSPGMRALVGIENLITFQVGLVSSDNSGSDLFSELFKVIGTELNANFGKGYYGKIHFFAYMDGVIKDASGYGLSFSGTIADKFKLFGRWNENNFNYSMNFHLNKAWSIGTEFNSDLFSQPIVVGAAFGVNKPYHNSFSDEYVGEAYFRFQFNQWVSLSPHIQYIKNAAGTQNDFLLAAIRTQINF